MRLVPVFLLTLFSFSACLDVQGSSPVEQQPPGVVIAHYAKQTKKYVGSPSLCILPNGTYLASHDEFGPGASAADGNVTQIYQSTDRGLTWQHLATLKGQGWSTLFIHRGVVYIFGTSGGYNDIVIRRSLDNGRHWTTPADNRSGLLFKGSYHTAPVPVVEYKGRLWRAFENTDTHLPWGKRFRAMVISAPADADLLNANNWRTSNELPFDSTYLEGRFHGWLEGNFVVGPHGKMYDVLRVDAPKLFEEQAAFVHIKKGGKKVYFNPQTDFCPFPGGSKKFSIRYDARSGRYWMLSNGLLHPVRQNTGTVRNTQILYCSKDLHHWQVCDTLLTHPDYKLHGFQYVDWQFDGDDIIFVSRTAYDDATGGADSYHNANYLTFHRVKDFRRLAKP